MKVTVGVKHLNNAQSRTDMAGIMLIYTKLGLMQNVCISWRSNSKHHFTFKKMRAG